MKNDFYDYMNNIDTHSEHTSQSQKDKCYTDVLNKMLLKSAGTSSQANENNEKDDEYNQIRTIIHKQTFTAGKAIACAACIAIIAGSSVIYSMFKNKDNIKHIPEDLKDYTWNTQETSINNYTDNTTSQVTSVSKNFNNNGNITSVLSQKSTQSVSDTSSETNTKPSSVSTTRSYTQVQQIVTNQTQPNVPDQTEQNIKNSDNTFVSQTVPVTEVSKDITVSSEITTTHAPETSKISKQTIDEGVLYTLDNGIKYKIINGCAYIDDYDRDIFKGIKTLELPSEINGYPLTTINEFAFNFNTEIEELIIPQTVTYIGEFAFSTCPNLTKVTFEDCTVTIGESAFSGCGIENADFGSKPVSIDRDAFNGCHFSKLIISKNMIFLNEMAFSRCVNLGEVIIDKDVEFTGSNLFYKCRNLSLVTYTDHQINEIKANWFLTTPFYEHNLETFTSENTN